MAILTQPDIRPVAWRLYRLHEAWSVEWRGTRIEVPEGFEHDGASVPRLTWTLSGLTPDGLLRAAALAHDWLYRHGGAPPGLERALSRSEADAMFYDLMVEAGVPRWRAYVAWSAVRSGGWWSWRRAG